MGKKKRPRQPGRGGTAWTVNDIRGIVHNPVYAGIGPYPALIDEATWIGAQQSLIKDDGAEAVLRQMYRALEETFGEAPAFMEQPGWFLHAAGECEEKGVRQFFTEFLASLRAVY